MNSPRKIRKDIHPALRSNTSFWIAGDEPPAPRMVHKPMVQQVRVEIEEQPVCQPISVTPSVSHIAYAVMQPVNVVSPIDRLWWLQDGWDGGRAERLSKTVLRNAIKVWNCAKEVTPDDLPRVNPSPDSYVMFSWSDHYPIKELQLSVMEPKKLSRDLSCHWVVRGKIGRESGDCSTIDSLKGIMSSYQEYRTDDEQ
jgi:hypothetical protein